MVTQCIKQRILAVGGVFTVTVAAVTKLGSIGDLTPVATGGVLITEMYIKYPMNELNNININTLPNSIETDTYVQLRTQFTAIFQVNPN